MMDDVEIDKKFKFCDMFNKLNIEKDSIIFIHAALRKLHKITGRDYPDIVQQIIKYLKKEFSPRAIVAPSFTPSFRTSGVYSVNHSKGEFGAFCDLFWRYADMRTEDCIHSVAIVGDKLEEFRILNYGDTFGSEGLWAHLNQEKSYILNINTNHFVSTQLHYIEEVVGVPYKKKTDKSFSGIIIDENDQIRNIVQINHEYYQKDPLKDKKIENFLINTGILSSTEYQKVRLLLIKTNELTTVIKKKLHEDPNFLVK